METIQNKTERILEQGVAPTVAIVRIGENDDSKDFEKRVEEAGNAFAIAVEKFIFPEISDETDVMDVLEVINDDPMIHAMILLRPMPEKFNELRIRSMLNPAKDIEGRQWGSLAGNDDATMQAFLEAVVDAAAVQVAQMEKEE